MRTFRSFNLISILAFSKAWGAAGVTRIEDVVVPELFGPYVQQMTQEKSVLIRSGAVVMSPEMSELLSGGGITFNVPSFKDLDDEAENVSSDDPDVHSTPKKIQTAQETQVRLSRNNSWSSMDLAGDLAGKDPMNAIASRVSNYWVLRLQAAFIATMTGVFADNAAAPAGADTHTEDDLTVDISGSSFTDGVTNFSAEAFIDAVTTMGDSMGEISLIMVHSLVYNRMLKNNLLDFISDSANPNAVPGRGIPTFLGRIVIISDKMPRTGGVLESWLFGEAAVQVGQGSPKVPTEIDRKPSAGNGSGQTVLHNRVEWIIHPNGHAYVGTTPPGGPSNASTSNNLAHADSWRRVFTERKQIRMARLISREYG